MTSHNLFTIKNLNCFYGKDRRVLSVDELVIPNNEMVIILGKSGIGKSTLLEALGLMSRTYDDSSEIKFREKEDVLDYNQLWRSDNTTITELRNRHFGFIFQSTNLMSNFSLAENVLVTSYLKSVSKNEAHNRYKQYKGLLGLGYLKDDHEVSAMSGGERQRLAFLRAIAPGYTVLFGDEPTGNLDEKNSFELMETLKESMSGIKAAIIVTHNIELALRYADRIIAISPDFKHIDDEVHCSGVINSKSVTRRMNGGWIDSSDTEIHDPLSWVQNKIYTDIH